MKYGKLMLCLLIMSCNSRKEKASAKDLPPDGKDANSATVEKNSSSDICWTGTINARTPVFLHYKQHGEILTGEIIYLDTKDKKPISLIGTMDTDSTFRLLEFERSGNITGIISGRPAGNIFMGRWFSPKRRRELSLSLTKKDSLVVSDNADAQTQDIFGSYHYQFSENGYIGYMEIKKLPGSRAAFGITSLTGPAGNVAQVEDDTIILKDTRFVYAIPNTDDCEFEVRFFKGFVYIKYTKGACEDQFGMNATIEGIYLKTE